MRYEVEQKHRVEDPEALMVRLERCGAALGELIVQRDQYFAHPARNFAETDEALRIRTVGGTSFVTYKGPKVDPTTKTRRELELPLDPRDSAGHHFAELLAVLGFTPVWVVQKQRRLFQLPRGQWIVMGALDDVDSLGTFIELELTADEANVGVAQRVIQSLADELQLGPSVRRSYLELLLLQ